MVRGIEKREIFRDDADRADFRDRLARLLPEEDITCFAWALMTNHVHLLVRTGPESSISRLMARLGTGHAARFNRRHVRVGHLFQNRFRSDLVADEGHLSSLLRYVHLNPVRAGVIGSVAELAEYPWTGHGALMGRADCPFLAVRDVLRWFGSDTASARRGLRHWMQLASSAPGPDLDAHPDESLAPARTAARRRSRQGAQTSRDGWNMALLLAWACAQTGASEADVRAGRRTASASETRAIAAYLAQRALAIRAVEMATTLQLGSGSASRAIRRGRELVARRRLVLPISPDADTLEDSSPGKQKAGTSPPPLSPREPCA
jgi:REP element-mobilizing transposase RayT